MNILQTWQKWFKPTEVDSYRLTLKPNIGPLRQQIHATFKLEELRSLCFDLQIDYEDLEGNTKTAKIESLIEYVLAYNLLTNLLEQLGQLRPHVTWHKPVPFTARELRNRTNLLHNVQATWIDGYLKNALSTAITLELGLTYQHQAVARKVLQIPDQADQPIPVDKPLHEIFEAYGRSLLILGDPGSGKTITLLQLAQDLIQQAQTDPSQPIPIVLNLSAWGQQRPSFDNWLVEEMLLQYQVARKLTRVWIAENQLLYLLDGLDEVGETYRDDCIAAINTFKTEYPAEIVVCSRTTDYERLKNRLNLSVAVRIEPLSEDEIQRHLGEAGPDLQPVRDLLNTDPNLHQLAHSPLMLNLMTIAYSGLSAASLQPPGSVEAHRQHLFKCYVEQMFQRRPISADASYTQAQAIHWLTNLAHGVEQHTQSIFYIERLQPSWLPPPQFRFYTLMIGLIVTLISGLLFGLTFGSYGEMDAGLIFISVYILLVFGWLLIYKPQFKISPIEGLTWAFPRPVSFFRTFSAIFLLLVGMFLTSFISIAFRSGLIGSLIVGIPIGLIYGLTARMGKGLVSLFNTSGTDKFHLGIYGRLIVGSLFGIFFGLFSLFMSEQGLFFAHASFAIILLVSTICGLAGGLIVEGFQGRETENRLEPNEGIHRSTQNALRFFLLGILGGLLYGFVLWWLNGQAFGLTNSWYFRLGGDGLAAVRIGLGIGITLGLLFGYMYGGYAVIAHYTLRYVLATYRILPLQRLVAFLDAMTTRTLLQRVGGGWIFIHRYLLEYFASLHPKAGEK